MFQDSGYYPDDDPQEAGEDSAYDYVIQRMEAEARPRKQEPKHQWRPSALALGVWIATSALFGFVGGYVSDRLRQSETPPVTGAEVLYQSVIRTVAAGDNSADGEMTMAAVAEMVNQTVVEIATETVTTSGRMGQLISEGAGSGVILSSDGYIVTNKHVVSGAKKIMVHLSDGREYPATLVGMDAKTDLAVLKINTSGLTPAVLGDSSALQVGETMVAVGNPLGSLGGTVTSGILSALDREITIDSETMSLLQTDASINPGNSGGGLFNLYGELVGIVNAKSSGTDIEGIGFAIPVNTAKTVMENIITYGYVRGRVDTGLTLIDISNTQAAMIYRVNRTGLYIYESNNSKLKSGDRIIAVDGIDITNLTNFNAVMDTRSVGDNVDITVSRNGQSLTVTITLTELKG